MSKIRGLLCMLLLSLITPALSISEVPLFTSTLIGPPFKEREGLWCKRIAPAGDVNGDGYADILVAGHLFRSIVSFDEVYLYFGSGGGIVVGNPIKVLTSVDRFYDDSTTISPAGDVDGDGYDDILVGGIHYDPDPLFGTVLYRGGPSGYQQPPAWAPDPKYLTGNVFAPAGDVNGDGYADVVFSGTFMEPGASYGTEAAFLFLGSSSGLGATPASALSFKQDRTTFASGFSAADVNHDGYSDLVVYASSWRWPDEPEKKILFLYYGGPNGYQSEPAWTLDEKSPSFEDCSLSLGDVNGDGNPDLLLGVPYWELPGGDLEGKIFLFYGNGKTFSKEADWSFQPEPPYSTFGLTAAVADVNGDGYGDVLAGAPLYGSSDELIPELLTGRLFFFPGSREGLGKSPAWVGREVYGMAMAAVGDVNGDGRADFASNIREWVTDNVNERLKVHYYFKEPGSDNSLPPSPTTTTSTAATGCFLETLGAER